MSDYEDTKRVRFLDIIWPMSDRQRAHTLGVESDEELEHLKRVALEQQHFEMAASIVAEIKRRGHEVPV